MTLTSTGRRARSVLALCAGAAVLADDELVLEPGATAVDCVGVGTMFGTTPLSGAELSERTLETLTSENADVPVHEMAEAPPSRRG
ncbi:hypothetical protein [Brachybacterium sp.]|uniref:hypothetical protein n=1 Tax=Brachybacterium sp. TaxID=1891286 RepID=UPI002ED14D70